MKVLLLSGGLDSATVLFDDFNKPDLCLTVDYGQLAVAEPRKAKALASGRNVPWQCVKVEWPIALTCGIVGGNIRTAAEAVVPGRNAMFIALAAMRGATEVVLGCNLDDYEAFVDCREDVLEGVGAACGVTVSVPLSGMTKAEVVRLAELRGVPVNFCMSCYAGKEPGCGLCAACRLRNGAGGVAG